MSGANVFVHESQFPENVRRELIDSLRRREINHKFHYETHKQSAKWLALHEAYSPARRDADCSRCYEAAFAAAAQIIDVGKIQVIGLGCGGGQKEARLLQMLADRQQQTSYAPVDVSLPLVLVARKEASRSLPVSDCYPILCDLATASGLVEVIDARMSRAQWRIVSLFGVIPNLEPQVFLPQVAALLRREDVLLLSANLAPGADYASGVLRVLPQYDNDQTRDWLFTFLSDLGVEAQDGAIDFSIETVTAGLKRIVARFDFDADRSIQVHEHDFAFRRGDSIRLLFSDRYTPAMLETVLRTHGIIIADQWQNDSGEEGVFLCRRI